MKPILTFLWFFVPALACPESRLASPDYTSEVYGFALTPPAFPKAQSGAAVAAIFFAAPEASFSANVNVAVQMQSVGLDAYRQTTLAEMEKASLTVNSQSALRISGRDALRIDYEGNLQSRKMRWLALAVLEKDHVLLVTCTALKENFEHYEKDFHACLDSFRPRE